MPRTADQAKRELWLGAGPAWTMASELVTATGVWAAIGYGLDVWLGTWPILFAIGAVVGNATGIYIIYRKTTQATQRARRARGMDV